MKWKWEEVLLGVRIYNNKNTNINYYNYNLIEYKIIFSESLCFV